MLGLLERKGRHFDEIVNPVAAHVAKMATPGTAMVKRQ